MLFTLLAKVFILATAATVASTLLRVALAWSSDTAQSRLWQSLDAVGVKKRNSIVSWLRAVASSVISTAQWSQEGYQKFSKSQNLPFTLPSLWTGRAVVVLPPSLLSLLNRPEGELAAHRGQLDSIQLPYMIADSDVYENPIHFDVVRRNMSRKDVGSMAADTAEALDDAFTSYWGTNTKDWVTLNNWDACGKVVTKAAMRVLVGETLSQDERLLDSSRKYATAVLKGTAFINLLHPVIRPYLGPLFGIQAKRYQARCLSILEPVIRERIAKWENTKEFGGEQDFLQWMIIRCAKASPEQLNPAKITMRLLGLATMSVMGMVHVLSNTVPDLYGNSSTAEFIAGLGAECQSVLAASDVDGTNHGISTEKDIQKLHRIDSTLRESLRLSNISVTSLARDVVSDSIYLGLDEHDIKLPRGVRVVFPTQDIHCDSSTYSNPYYFDAFRFSRDFEGLKDDQDHAQRDSIASTTITPSFLAFGYGRRACPGRWYAMQTLKQALSYIVLNYDVEVAGKPTEKMVLLNVFVPQTERQIRIRRKRVSAS